MKVYSNYRAEIARPSAKQIINDYVYAIPFEARREPYEDKQMRYEGFKRWLSAVAETPSDYQHGIKRFCDKVLF